MSRVSRDYMCSTPLMAIKESADLHINHNCTVCVTFFLHLRPSLRTHVQLTRSIERTFCQLLFPFLYHFFRDHLIDTNVILSIAALNQLASYSSFFSLSCHLI